MNEEKVIEKLLDHDKRFEEIDQRFDTLENKLTDFRDEYLRGQDQMMKILIRLDEDKRHDVLLNKIKAHLNLA
ncbi:MAG TPA: hypothetical protein VEA18_01385 [Candidatus Kapabacteria bacterium]|nr:hypothetical protein [Candidatus Kapabacteria bacterium]